MRAIAAVAVVLLVAAGACAQTGEEQARAHFRAGQTEYARGRYRAALDEFQLGYALSPRPEFLINFAQAYRKLGEFERAIVECERFLATAPPEPLASEAQRLLGQLREEQARARANPPATEGAPPSANQPSTNQPSASQPSTNQPSTNHPSQPSASQPSANQPSQPSPVVVTTPPAPARKRRWVVPVAVGVSVAVLAAAGIALGVTLGAHDTYPATPLGTVSFR